MRTTETYTSAAASLTGFASNVTGATWALTANEAGDGLGHQVTIRNDSATNHTDKTAVLTGTDPTGAALTETVTLPNTSATVTSTGYFLTLTSVVPSATIGADTMDIGWAVTSATPPVLMDHDQSDFNVGFGCTVVSGTSPTYTAQQTYDDVAWYDHASVASETTSQKGTATSPFSALRLTFAAAGGVVLTVLQAGKKHK